MKFSAIFFLMFFINLTGCGVLYNQFGGPFKGTPEELFKNDVLNNNARELLIQAFTGLEGRKMSDYHLHFVGFGTIVKTCPELNQLPDKQKPKINWEEIVRHQDWWQQPFFKGILLDSADVNDESQADEQYIKRILDMVAAYRTPPNFNNLSNNPYQTEFHLLAMDGKYDWKGQYDSSSIFYVSNQYIVKLANCLNERLRISGGFTDNEFKAVGSINPMRACDKDNDKSRCMRDKKDWLPELDFLKENGVQWIKWRPATMNFDPAIVSEEFYNALKERKIGIITHTGDSTGMKVREELNQLADPYKLERAIQLGINVVMLHIGRAGDDYSGKTFELLKKYHKHDQTYHLLGEMSAVPYGDSANQLKVVIDEGIEWLVNGSDYPIVTPYIFVKDTLKHLEKLHFISEKNRMALDQIYHYNPLLFDFVLKRSLIIEGKKLPLNFFLSVDTVTFEFVHLKNKTAATYRASTSDPEVIRLARTELAKPFKDRKLHINGKLSEGTDDNDPWNWHFETDSWQLTENSAELCDADPQYVEDNLKEWLKTVGRYCPYHARVSREVKK